MTKKEILNRLTASGMLLVTVAGTLGTVGGGVSYALQPSSTYGESQYEKDLADYKVKKAAYDKALAEYKTAKAKYDEDVKRFNKENAEYNKALEIYNKQLTEYNQKKVEYERALADAEKNKNTPGYLSEVSSKYLIFDNETTKNAKLDSVTGVQYYSAKKYKEIADQHHNGFAALTSDWRGDLVSNSKDAKLEDGSIIGRLEVGKTATVHYSNLNALYNGKRIASAEYRYTLKSSNSKYNAINAAFSSSPTHTIDVGTLSGTEGFEISFEAIFYDENGKEIVPENDKPFMYSVASLNSYGENTSHIEYAKIIDNSKFIKISGSYVDRHGNDIYANKDIEDPNKLGIDQPWDRETSPYSYIGAGVISTNQRVKFNFGVKTSGQFSGIVNEWFAFNTNFKAKGIPVAPVPPKEPTKPKPLMDKPNPPQPVEPPVSPTTIRKSVSTDDKTYVSAEDKSKALDVKTKDATWYWKLEANLSTNTNYTSLTIADNIESVQTVNESDIHVYDINGKDVTSEGTISKSANAGGTSTKYAWTAKQSYLNTLNSTYGTTNPLTRPKLTMKIKATTKNADPAKLLQYLEQTSHQTIIPNIATIEVADAKGRITENSNPSHVKFVVENTVSNPEKKVSDLNEKNVNKNNLGLIDRNQKYTISFDTGKGAYFSKLNITDQMPNGFKAAGTAKITNSAGKDITNLFDISFNGQTFRASVKDSAKGSEDLRGTKVSIEIAGTSVRWLGGTIKNKASVEDFKKRIETNETVTVIPKDGTALKEASVNDNQYAKAETDANSVKVPSAKANYFWRNTFTLPNLTDFTKIDIHDTFETVQAIDTKSMQVLDSEGQNVASRGEFKTEKLNDKQTRITWSAKADYIAELNAKFGSKSDVHPTLTLKITTNVAKATSSQLQAYKTPDKNIIIPNTADIALRDNSGINLDYNMTTNISKVNVPSDVDPGNAPEKTVSDDNEKDVNTNNLGFDKLNQTYSIKGTTTAGYRIEKFNFIDQLPASFKTSPDQVSITTSDGTNVKDLFDIVIDGNNRLTANLKDSAKEDKRVIDTEITLKVAGTMTKGLGQEVINKAQIEGQNGSVDTNQAKTRVPSTPESHKTVSVDGGKNYSEAGELKKRSDEYIWKVDHTLSNFTEYEAITLNDELENVQDVDLKKVHVFNYDGADVTAKGDLKVVNSGNRKVVTWTAKSDFVASLNKKFGKASADKPRLAMQVSTNVAKAKGTDEARYYNAQSDRVEIPNNAGQSLTAKNEGSITTKSNTPKVTLPKPGESKATKYVAKAGSNPQWSDKLQLDNFDSKYQYRTEFKIAENFNFDKGGLVLSDNFENLQSYKAIKMLDASGADITSKFDIKAVKSDSNKGQTVITATPKNADDFDDVGTTVNMVIEDATLSGSKGIEQVSYLSTQDSEGGFHSGITVPNISKIQTTSAIPNHSTTKESNKTFVNFDLTASLSKKAENEVKEVVNPKDAKESTTLSDLIASAQKLLTNPGKLSTDKLEKISKALTDSKTTKEQLLNLLISAR